MTKNKVLKTALTAAALLALSVSLGGCALIDLLGGLLG